MCIITIRKHNQTSHMISDIEFFQPGLKIRNSPILPTRVHTLAHHVRTHMYNDPPGVGKKFFGPHVNMNMHINIESEI